MQELVDSYALSGRWHECLGEVLRFQIINGSLWIDHLSERHSGWYPARLGPGNVYSPHHMLMLHVCLLLLSVLLVRQLFSQVYIAAGALSGKGKIPYAVLGLLDVIRHYPGQVRRLLECL